MVYLLNILEIHISVKSQCLSKPINVKITSYSTVNLQ